MDSKLLEILVCPLCKGKVTYHKDRQEIQCQFDKLAFPIKDGIPIMLEQEARLMTEG